MDIDGIQQGGDLVLSNQTRRVHPSKASRLIIITTVYCLSYSLVYSFGHFCAR